VTLVHTSTFFVVLPCLDTLVATFPSLLFSCFLDGCGISGLTNNIVAVSIEAGFECTAWHTSESYGRRAGLSVIGSIGIVPLYLADDCCLLLNVVDF